MGAAAVTPMLPLRTVAAKDTPQPWWLGNGMPQESAATPKIACGIDVRNGVTDEAIRSVVQIGVYHVLLNGPAIPWTVDQLQPIVDKLSGGGVTLGNLMITGFPNVVYGRPGRDEEIEKIRQSIQAAGQPEFPSWNTTSTRTGQWRATSKRPGGAAPD
jgi:mannonate dehydratase